jgi:Flp pilus assembly protein TadD
MKNALAGASLLLLALSAFAQSPIRLPDASPAASAGQTVGVTDINITYHRPAVNKRRIWGGLVPYDTIWRTGANENTTISFSTPVKIEGQALPAGTYALYAIPGAAQWTMIFSKFTGDWGAYNYDPAEDALRVSVTPQTSAESQERLSYTFDDVTNNAVTASLRWEKLRVPMKIEVDLPSTVRASIASTLRGGKHWDPSAWSAAARWELRNGNPDTALEYINHALSLSTTSGALRTKAAILEKKGDAKAAAELRDRAKSMYTEPETIALGYGTPMSQKKYDDAIAFLNNYAAAHPSSAELWRIYAGLGEAYSAKGDAAKAKENFDKAMAAAHDMAERTEVWDSINSVASEIK